MIRNVIYKVTFSLNERGGKSRRAKTISACPIAYRFSKCEKLVETPNNIDLPPRVFFFFCS